MLDKKYDHKQVENGKYEEWKDAGYFESQINQKKLFV